MLPVTLLSQISSKLKAPRGKQNEKGSAAESRSGQAKHAHCFSISASCHDCRWGAIAVVNLIGRFAMLPLAVYSQKVTAGIAVGGAGAQLVVVKL